MAVVSRIATLRIDDTATHITNILTYVATAATQDTAAGSSVVVTIVKSLVGTPPSDPNTLTLNFYTDSGTLIRAIALDPSSFSQTATFHFTSDGTSGGAARSGTVEIAIRATRTSLGTYDIETDGTPNTPPAASDTHLDRGWIRGTTTAVTVLSNVSLGGGKSSPAEYDESLFARTTLGAASYLSRTLTIAVSSSSPALSGTATGTGPVFDVTYTNVVDNRFPAAATTVNTSIGTLANSSLTGQPWTVLTVTNDSMSVDPRLTASHHFQVDDDTFSLAINDTSRQMLSTQTAFLATRFVTARTATGVNGLTVTQTLTPVGPGTAVTASSSTALRDTQNGWTDLMTWLSSKPGGVWDKTISVTAPADITGATYVLSGTAAYTLLAPDPRFTVVLGGGPTVITEHFVPGDTFQVGATVVNVETGLRQVVTSATVALLRMADAALGAPTAGFGQYLDEFNVWQTLTTAPGPGDTGVLHFHTLAESRANSGIYVKNFNAASGFDTSGWGSYDVFLIARMVVGGTPYSARYQVEALGAVNKHSGYEVDAVRLALNGQIGLR